MIRLAGIAVLGDRRARMRAWLGGVPERLKGLPC